MKCYSIHTALVIWVGSSYSVLGLPSALALKLGQRTPALNERHLKLSCVAIVPGRDQLPIVQCITSGLPLNNYEDYSAGHRLLMITSRVKVHGLGALRFALAHIASVVYGAFANAQ